MKTKKGNYGTDHRMTDDAIAVNLQGNLAKIAALEVENEQYTKLLIKNRKSKIAESKVNG